MAKKRTGTGKKQPPLYHPDVMYPFWSAAGGNILEAMRLATEAGEKRVPSKHETWSKYAEENGFPARLAKEESERWQTYSKEREANQQKVLDRIAHSFEQMADTFVLSLNADFKKIKTLEAKDADRLFAEKRLTKLFGTMDAVDKFFRMYLRARGLPEKISRNINEQTDVPLGYGDLESQPPKAKTPEEARKMAEEQ